MHSQCRACLLAVLLAGCTSATQAPRGEPQSVAAPVPAEAVKPAETAPVPAPRPAAPPAIAAVPPVAPDAAPPSDSKVPPVPKTVPPAAPPAKPVVPSTPAPQSAPNAVAVAPAKPPSPPPLDLKSLETRLKETKAIGVFTKVTLKNQVDDLLDAFRAYYKGQAKSTLAELRRAYDQLVLKVLALLQDADPQLAAAIASSREAIWGILSDRTKFANV